MRRVNTLASLLWIGAVTERTLRYHPLAKFLSEPRERRCVDVRADRALDVIPCYLQVNDGDFDIVNL